MRRRDVLLGGVAASVPAWAAAQCVTSTRGSVLEETRTNLVFPSVSGSPPWNASGTGTRTDNAGTAPNGTNTATQIVADATNGVHGFTLSTTPAGATVYTQSIFAKAGTSSKASLEFRVAPNWVGGVCWPVFDLTAGTVFSITGTVSGTITPVGNGWYRLTATATTTAAPISSNFWANVCNAAGSDAFAGAGESALFWGWQVEAGAFATSYIPTTSASATRLTDSCSIPTR